ncbi:flagellar protein G [Thermococcus profundus]|uniref:Flagellar protein G n=1 Tax=Thermococcus profundus TaxID=49899 RepID=A0A2Z2MJF2_THEPR|nr:flagellar protein G [Thermococcus profundus]ASJ02561.1 flagellar protein G [Thermococcus profundus]
MAAGGPASELIMFIVAIIVAGSVAGALAYVTNDIAHGINDNGALMADKLRTDFAIINDPNNIPTDADGKYMFYIKNIGKVSFPFSSDSVQVFIDGNIIPPANLTFTDVNNNEITSLNPYDVGVIHVQTTIDTGYHRIQIVLENGKKRSLVFKK